MSISQRLVRVRSRRSKAPRTSSFSVRLWSDWGVSIPYCQEQAEPKTSLTGTMLPWVRQGRWFRADCLGGAVYVVRGQVSGPLAESLDASDFSGGDSAGHTYLGRATGDQAGAMLHSAGDLFGDDGFVELVIGAPFDDGPGRPDTGVHYIVPGRLNGANPTGFDLGNVGPGDGLSAIRIFGAGTQDGVRGVFASGVGDFDLDGEPDLAVGFPAASVLVNGSVITEGGFASYLSGAALDPSTQHTIDLAGSLAGIELLRLYGEALGAHGGVVAGGW